MAGYGPPSGSRPRHSALAPVMGDERGLALLTTILMMVLMSALLVGFTTAVTSDQTYRSIDRDRARAFYGAQSGIEKQNADLARLFVNQVAPADAQVVALGATSYRPTIPAVQFVDVGSSPAYRVMPLGPAISGIISSGPYEGLMALKRQFQLDATARAVDGGEVHLKRTVETTAIPVFQFGVFSSVDLSFSAGDDFDFGGRVHTNGNLFLSQGAGSILRLREKVTAVGEIVRQRLSNRESIDASGSTGIVSMTRGNASGPFRTLSRNEGSVTDGVTPPTLSNAWRTLSLSSYNGNIRNNRTGVRPLNLDLVTANGANIDLIRRPPAGEPVTSPVFAERYFRKVSLRILLSDLAADITALPTVTPTPPVALDGDWFAAPPAGYTPPPALYPTPVSAATVPLARSVGPVPDLPAASTLSTVGANVAAGTSQAITLTPSMPDYFKLRPNLILSWNGGAASMTVTCAGKDALKFTGCSRTGGTAFPVTVNLPAMIAVTIATVEGDRIISAPLSTGVGAWNGGTKDIVLGVAGFPTAPFTVNTFFVAEKNLLVTCTGYNSNAPPQFTGCNVPNTGSGPSISAGDRIGPEALSNAGVGRIGGQLKVEIQLSTGAWQDVTAEFLSYGISGPNLAGRSCPDPTPNAILRFQRLRDNNESGAGACSYAAPGMPVLSSDHWPNTLFDPREGASRDGAPAGHANRVTIGGVMHYVTLDVRNLSLWFTRAGAYAAGSGNLAMREGGSPTGGYSVYFSDRRNNRSATGQETGEYGWEDVVNPASAVGAPNGILDGGEDVNANGVLDTYGAQTSYMGVRGTAPPGARPPLDANRPPYDFIAAGQAKVNRALHFRRALKLVNGSLGNIVAPGLTVAAENPVYIQGDWNASVAAGFGNPHVATSVVADAVTLLSNSWNDVSSYGTPTSQNPWVTTHRPRSSNTYYRLAIIAGKGPVFARPSGGGPTYGTDGGAHSFLRFIEGDGGGNDKVWYRGSLVTFYYHRQAVSPFKCCSGMVYGVPAREYGFDSDFLNPGLLPPLTPVFRDLNALGFTQETRPGR